METTSFVSARTEIQFFSGECCVQTNLPLPRNQEVYYWEAKMFEKPTTTMVSVGVATKPYPYWRLPGSVALYEREREVVRYRQLANMFTNYRLE